MLRLSAFLLLILVCPRVDAFCFESAGAKYHIDPLLVKAIAIGESSLRPGVTNINRDKKTGQALSTDYGLMQVNSSHIPSLIAQGYIRSSQDLLNRPCLNVQIGTWILAKHFQVCGISWNCLGSYNAGFRKDRHETRESYANRIYAIYRRLLLNERGIKL
ncbi:lytic transglycosylase domain-containing protein [Salmonella enterica subsp. enterica serovar Agona]|uniref:Lytic transglycosylase domain-containing protein n=1 Tax=Enterobacter asburiae TaxID=61645 RepID=A0A8I1FZG5_ENTAS|nr:MULTISPECIES: lytic transglycosylase domain-containing protein [Enterobacteriaceae]EBF2118882.1 lytic transglycosylase domain-containing protein [Salmonella enterica]EBW3175233.1 pilus assembly protein [Salmonella enterica subsp. enterica serovar Javiana]ECG2456734.1 pilus assembly protein [Salmonella enterica subsp. enterica serovar Infantis]EDE4573232.1 transglycosylase SLT domain-containing protein [Salmonella enterica subsp. enterica serovar Montevideo]EDT3670440.1 lytic transglycosylas